LADAQRGRSEAARGDLALYELESALVDDSPRAQFSVASARVNLRRLSREEPYIFEEFVEFSRGKAIAFSDLSALFLTRGRGVAGRPFHDKKQYLR
jgi:hypothetical protein